MDNVIEKSLALLGYTPVEIRFFLACFSSTPANINQLAKTARLRRSTAYAVAKKLIADGLVFEDNKAYANKLYPLEPKKLLQVIADKQRRLRRAEVDLEENLPRLQSLFQASDIRPKVQVYQGTAGLLQVWQDILSAKSELLLWTNQQTENQFFGPKNHDKFIAQRIAKHLSIRVLATDTSASHALKQLDSVSLRHTKILPASVNFSAETYLYDHKIAILDYNQDIIGVIMDSLPIFTFHHSVFNLTWNTL